MTLALLAALALPQQGHDSTAAQRPFHVGERFQYSAKLGFLRLGTAWMSVNSVDTLRGIESYVFEFGLEASAPFYKSTNILKSWTGTADLVSRRFTQDLVENDRPTKRYYDIFPDSLFYTQEQRPGTAKPTVAQPLDDAAFFYFLRTIPLEMGKKYEYERYFRQEMNPVVIKVIKREKMELPNGKEVACLVLSPVVGDEGIFAPRAQALLWLTDDERRVPVQIRSKLPFGTVTLTLEKLSAEPPAQ
jgi:hypothetical protein